MATTRGTVPGEPGDELLSLVQAKEFLGISQATMYRLMEQGDVKGMKVGNRWRFRNTDLLAYLNRDSLAVAAAGVSHDIFDGELAFFAERLKTPVSDFEEGDEPREQKTVALVNSIFVLAISMGVSDIHLELARLEGADVSLLRYRVDGVLHEIRRMPKELHAAIIQRVKTMCEMSIEERRLPQDGRIHLRHAGHDLDIRVNIAPMVFGEALTARLLDQRNVSIDMNRLGFLPDDLARLRDLIHRPSGIILFTGPTGSGNTTSLYSCLLEIANAERKTLTIEDPVEYLLPWTTQSMVNVKAGYTFPVAVRSFLRQDPDIILVGEIRDRETIEIAVQAALTGHLLFSTLHTNSAAEALTRMVDIGVEPFLITGAVTGVVAQRLVRKLCPACRQPISLPEERLCELGLSAEEMRDATFYTTGGCPECFHRGYRGRIGIYEILTMNDAMVDLVLHHAPAEELTRTMQASGMTTMLQDGLRKAQAGLTTVEEVLRVAG